MNRIKDLRNLFLDGMKRKRREAVSYTSGYTSHYPYNASKFMASSVPLKIYFYEWSDTTRVPRAFYDMKYFEMFLKNCNIILEPYNRDIINTLGTVYIACYKGSKKLCIRASEYNLTKELRDKEKRDNGGYLPNTPCVPILRIGNSMPQNDGTFFG